MNNASGFCAHATPADRPCIHCCLSNVLARTERVPQEVLALVGQIQERRVRRGEALYREGEHASLLVIIRDGLVKLTQSLPNGQQRIVRLLHDSDIIGLESLVNHLSRHTATAIIDTRICEVPVSLIRRLELLDPQVHERLMAQWQRNLDEADSFITELSTGTGEARLARLLLKLSERHHGTTYPALSREDIGAIIGVSTETASRLMARFKREALTQEHDDRFSAFDVASLTRIAET